LVDLRGQQYQNIKYCLLYLKSDICKMHDDEHAIKIGDSCLYSSGKMALFGGWIGALASSFESINRPVSASVLHVAGRAATKYVLPFAFAGLIYGGATCLLDNKRGASHHTQLTNSAIGGCIAGMVIGAKYPNPYKSIQLGLGLALVGLGVRLGSTGILTSDNFEVKRQKLDNKLNMKHIAHLAPQSSPQ